jgi:hypothetical protein
MMRQSGDLPTFDIDAATATGETGVARIWLSIDPPAGCPGRTSIIAAQQRA